MVFARACVYATSMLPCARIERLRTVDGVNLGVRVNVPDTLHVDN